MLIIILFGISRNVLVDFMVLKTIVGLDSSLEGNRSFVTKIFNVFLSLAYFVKIIRIPQSFSHGQLPSVIFLLNILPMQIKSPLQTTLFSIKPLNLFSLSCHYIRDILRNGGKILFIGVPQGLILALFFFFFFLLNFQYASFIATH